VSNQAEPMRIKLASSCDRHTCAFRCVGFILPTGLGILQQLGSWVTLIRHPSSEGGVRVCIIGARYHFARLVSLIKDST